MPLFYRLPCNQNDYRDPKECITMSEKMEVYYFSPTGGTKKVTRIFADAMAGEARWYDLGGKELLPRR